MVGRPNNIVCCFHLETLMTGRLLQGTCLGGNDFWVTSGWLGYVVLTEKSKCRHSYTHSPPDWTVWLRPGLQCCVCDTEWGH